jgi:NADP-reducing hydrogenase subunit HndD
MEMAIRKSHENPEIVQIYEDFLIEPLGKMSHKLLHTHYIARHR